MADAMRAAIIERSKGSEHKPWVMYAFALNIRTICSSVSAGQAR